MFPPETCELQTEVVQVSGALCILMQWPHPTLKYCPSACTVAPFLAGYNLDINLICSAVGGFCLASVYSLLHKRVRQGIRNMV